MKNENVESLTYSIPQAAKVIGVSTRTMYTLANRKDFPAIRITPNRIIVSRAGLEAWVQKQIDCKGGAG